MRRKVSFWQGLRAGQLEAEPQYQVFTHKGPPSFLPLSAKSKNPVGNSLEHGQGKPSLSFGSTIF